MTDLDTNGPEPIVIWQDHRTRVVVSPKRDHVTVERHVGYDAMNAKNWVPIDEDEWPRTVGQVLIELARQVGLL